MLKTEAINALKSDIVDVTFTKTDGTQRQMRCTLKDEFIGSYTPSQNAKPRKENPNPVNVSVWDVDKNGWRSFLWANVLTFNGVQTPNGIQ